MNPNPWTVSNVTVTTISGVEHVGPSASIWFTADGAMSVVQVTKADHKVTLPANQVASIAHL